MGAEQCGTRYWCAKVSFDLAEDGEIYVYADEVAVENGALVFLRIRDDGTYPNLTIAAGQWWAVFAASVMDGSAAAVEHWKGEVAE